MHAATLNKGAMKLSYIFVSDTIFWPELAEVHAVITVSGMYEAV